MIDNNYNLSSEVSDELARLMHSLKEFAVLHSIPMFITCAIKNSDKETAYKTDALTPAGTNRVLADNKFLNLINVMNGADTHYVSKETDIILDAIRELPNSIIESDYSEFSDMNTDDDDFYGEGFLTE